MKINSSVNIIKIKQNQNINNLTGHITRNPQHMRNSNINVKYSKFNYYKNIGTPVNSYQIGHYNGNDKTRQKLLDKLDRQHYGSYLRKRNLKYKKQHRLAQITSFEKFMSKSSRKHRVEVQVATLGHNARQKIDKVIQGKYWQTPKKALKTKEIKAWSSAMRYYANHYNDRHKYLKCISYGTNVDEIKQHTGAPHVHMIIYNQGHTRKDKPSSSFSNAIKLEENTSNNKKAFSKYHKQEARAIIGACTTVLNQRFQNLNLALSYQPNHNQTTGLNMNEYKKLTQKQNQKLYKQRQNIAKIEKQLEKERKQRKSYKKSRNYYSSQASAYAIQAQNDASGGLSKASSYIDSGISKGHNYAYNGIQRASEYISNAQSCGRKYEESGFRFSVSASQGVAHSVADVDSSLKSKSSSFNSNYRQLYQQIVAANNRINQKMKKLKKQNKRTQHLKITKVEQAKKVIRQQQRETSERAQEARNRQNRERQLYEMGQQGLQI